MLQDVWDKNKNTARRKVAAYIAATFFDQVYPDPWIFNIYTFSTLEESQKLPLQIKINSSHCLIDILSTSMLLSSCQRSGHITQYPDGGTCRTPGGWYRLAVCISCPSVLCGLSLPFALDNREKGGHWHSTVEAVLQEPCTCMGVFRKWETSENASGMRDTYGTRLLLIIIPFGIFLKTQ